MIYIANANAICTLNTYFSIYFRQLTIFRHTSQGHDQPHFFLGPQACNYRRYGVKNPILRPICHSLPTLARFRIQIALISIL